MFSRILSTITLTALATGLASTASAERYRIELKAWIPSNYVVDPAPGLGLDNCYMHIRDLSWWDCDSKFSGDGHVGYNGSYRVLSRLTFNWDGGSATNLRHNDLYGVTKRHHTLQKYLGSSDKHSHSRRQDSRANYKRIDYSTIELSYKSRNPHMESLPLVDAPAIDGKAKFHLSSGSIYVDARTDNFPSHGVAVYRYSSGRWIKQDSCVLRDASGVNSDSVVAVSRGLTSSNNHSCYLNWNG